MTPFEDLMARGLIKQATSVDQLRAQLETHTTFYIGFDPTAESLHLGHLLPLVTAKRLMHAGHRGIMLIGGATAMIGDPTGKSAARRMMSQSEIRVNTEEIRAQIEGICNSPRCVHANNLEWFNGIGFLTMLRDIGPHFSVNNMLRAECFRSRMESGLSFLELNYMVLQAFDFLHLFQERGCTLQIGGDDQWSNMLAGRDLIHKKTGADTALAMTLPLLLNSDGTKMGKTEKGAIWLDSEKTSPFDFWQFWRSLPDAEVKKCMKLLTFLSVEAIDGMAFETPEQIAAAKKLLATSVTGIVHGLAKATEVQASAEALFERKDPSALPSEPMDEGFALVDALVFCDFAKSKTEARKLIVNRGVTINGNVVQNFALLLSSAEFGKDIVIGKGKKQFRKFTFGV